MFKTIPRLLLWLLLFTGSFQAFTQPLPIVQEKKTREEFETARSYYDIKLYSEALKQFLVLLEKDPANANLNFLVGECMINISGRENEAVVYMKKAVENVVADYQNLPQQRRAPVYAFEKLGDLYYQDYSFDLALTSYRSFMTYLDPKKDKELLDRVNGKIHKTSNAKLILSNPRKMTLTELPYLNVISFCDYGARTSEDGNSVYFTRRRISESIENATSDIFYMRKVEGKWSRPVRMPFVNTEADDDFCWISGEENLMILCSNRDGAYHLYNSERKGKSQWTQPALFGSNINSKSGEYHGCTSHDGNTLYFVSDRKGGIGGKDIYRCTRTPGSEWGPAENLGGKVNSALDEDGPYLSRNGKRLYYSSQSFTSLGGYDVYYVTLGPDGNWSDPVNAGYPVNTTGDDLYFHHSFLGKPDYLISRSKPGKNEFTVSMLNDSQTATNLTDIKSKESAKEKTKLKLVPKTLKY